MKTARLPCGCRYQTGDVERWVELCPPHKAETDELHQRALREHREQSVHHFPANITRARHESPEAL